MQLGHQSAIVLRLHIQLTSRRFDCAAAEKPGVYSVNCMRALSLVLISNTRNKMAPLAKKVKVALTIAAILLVRQENCGKVVCGSDQTHTHARTHPRLHARTHARTHTYRWFQSVRHSCAEPRISLACYWLADRRRSSCVVDNSYTRNLGSSRRLLRGYICNCRLSGE